MKTLAYIGYYFIVYFILILGIGLLCYTIKNDRFGEIMMCSMFSYLVGKVEEILFPKIFKS